MIAAGGMLFVPDQLVPKYAWPLAAGVGSLIYVLVRSVRARTYRDEEFGPGMAGVMFTTLGIALMLGHGQYLISLLVALGVSLLAGIVWSAWKASRARH